MTDSLCAQCGEPFKPKRKTARYCGGACRVAAHRKVAACNATTATAPAAYALVCEEASGITPVAEKPLSVTETPLPKGIVPDERHPDMYRLRLPGGGLSDTVNLTRARDALEWLQYHRKATP
jgi:hypothetical protein